MLRSKKEFIFKNNEQILFKSEKPAKFITNFPLYNLYKIYKKIKVFIQELVRFYADYRIMQPNFFREPFAAYARHLFAWGLTSCLSQ
jgi:hypothetical protein